MSWAGSAVFRAYVIDCINPHPQVRNTWAAAGARFYLALFGSNVFPNESVPRADSFYGAGTWTPGNQAGAAGWPAAGVAGLMTQVYDPATGKGGLVPPPGTGPQAPGPVSVDFTGGDLLYDRTTGQGLAFHDWGGRVVVTAGSVTVTWAAGQYACGLMFPS
jgi:hypothetical protein